MVNRQKAKRHLISVHAAAPIEHANLKMRRVLMKYIIGEVVQARLTQSEVARMFGVTQPRISNLMREKVESFSIDSLVNMLGKMGMGVKLSFEAKL